MSKEDILAAFDPNGPGSNDSLFGLPFGEEHSKVIVIPVPWEATVSYKAGTAEGPEAILEASSQVDLYLKYAPDAWKMGIHMLSVDEKLKDEYQKFRDLAVQYISFLENNPADWITDDLRVIPKAVDEMAEKVAIYVKSNALRILEKGKIPVVLGGDHSTPLGLMRAVSSRYPEFGILQIDAHADLRKSYENFTYSHASIMYNALGINAMTKLVQVGIRDFCEEEMEVIKKSNGRIQTFFDEDIKNDLFEGKTWKQKCNEIIKHLPEFVYLSFDIDGLDPSFCPNTGTPVPGGLSFNEALYLIRQVVESGRKIIAFDLNEVAPGEDEWDANVGARLLYNLAALTAISQKSLQLNA